MQSRASLDGSTHPFTNSLHRVAQQVASAGVRCQGAEEQGAEMPMERAVPLRVFVSGKVATHLPHAAKWRPPCLLATASSRIARGS